MLSLFRTSPQDQLIEYGMKESPSRLSKFVGWLKNVIIFALLFIAFQNYIHNVEKAATNAGYEWGFEVGKDEGKEEACMIKAI